MDNQIIEFYCPACGEYSNIEFIILSPGEYIITCQKCNINWNINVNYYESSEKNEPSLKPVDK